MLTRDQIRNYIDHMGIPSHIDDDGDICASFKADEDFPYPVEVSVVVRKDRLSFIAFPLGYKTDDVLHKANRMNCRRNFPTAIVIDGKLRLEYSFYISEDVSDEYIYKTCIHQTLASMLQALAEFYNEDI